MSEITKLYENCNIKPKQEGYCDWDSNCPYPLLKCNDECPYWKDEDEAKYPPFTAEKQIAVIMFILNKFGDIGFQEMYSIRGNDETTRKDFIKCLCDCEHETIDSRPVDFYYQNGANGDNLEESIAGLINTLWQDLTEEERKEIKSILQGV